MRSRRWARGVVVLALAVSLVFSVVAALGMGSVTVSPGTVLDVVLRRGHLVEGAQVTVIDDRIVWELRLPRVLAAAAAGSVLAQCGALLQATTRNELADPYLLGISGGASAGAVVALLTGWSLPGSGPAVGVSLAAFVGGMVALAAVLALATGRSGDLPPGRTVLAGVTVSQLAAAVTSTVIMVFADQDGVRMMLAWTFGSFAGVRAPAAWALSLLAVITAVACLWAARTMDAFAFGDLSAASLGVEVRRARWLVCVGCALVVAGTVAFAGPIGFVGLTVPHVLRRLVGVRHGVLLPACAVGGALLLLWADTVARTVGAGQEVPIGVVTALVGAPVMAILLRRRVAA
ncbi:FecCD family ABC transporter permease [Austwickia chelonae]|uniref:FecCD family ABC transporter permease n=1 Tax=Austwickia chelonae TaxID=100225 RepID=UPI000E21C685|nr:iron ABC transporter permease [Austwickia chelonae]